MKILFHLKEGAVRSLKSWKGVLIIWVLILFLISLIALPMKAGVRNILGASMVTDLLKDGINADVVADFGSNLRTLLSSLSYGFFVIFFLGFILNVFLTGGLFSLLRKQQSTHTVREFFSGGVANFGSFLVVSFFCVLIISVVLLIVVGIPLSVRAASDSRVEGAMLSSGRTFGIILALLIPVFLLIADYSRAWQADQENKAAFKALNFGFSRTFRTFFSSYPVMLFLVIVQAGFGIFVLNKTLGMKPVTGGAVFQFFLLSQILFIIKLFLRAWRYGSITSMSEQEIQTVENNLDQQYQDTYQYNDKA